MRHITRIAFSIFTTVFVLIIMAALTAATLSQDSPTAVSVEDVEVISALEFDLFGGPLNTGAYLSPDGIRFAHAQGRQGICFYNVLGMQQRCTSFEDIDSDNKTLRDFDPDSLYWSPDGEWITFTTRSLVMFRDSDIWVMNADTGEITNLTDDGTDELGFLSPSDAPADLDLSPRWLPDGRIAFLRYNRAAGITSAPNLFAVSPEGGDVEQIGILPHGNMPLLVTKFSPSADGTQVIYPVDRLDEENAGIWISDINGDNARPLWSFAPDDIPEEMTGIHPLFGEFSPDSLHALMVGYDTRFDARFESAVSPARVGSLEDDASTVTQIDTGHYVNNGGWSPDGSAFAYLVVGPFGSETAGLYLTTTPGEPGRMVYPGGFFVPTSLQRQHIIWGENNTILLSRRDTQKLVAITLGP